MSEQRIIGELELVRRQRTLQAEMARRGVDVLLIDQPESIFHLIAYAMSEGYQQFCVLPAQGAPVMILRSVDAGTCVDYSILPDANVVGYADWQDPVGVLYEQIEARGLPCARIGIDRDSYNMTLNRFAQLQGAFPGTKWEDFSDTLRDMRAIKCADELRLLQRACDIADQTLAAILREFRPGQTDRDCVAMAAACSIRFGGDAGVVGPVTKALTDSRMHAPVADVPLGPGDILHVELIPQYFGYSARMMRPVFIGEPDPELCEVAARIVEIQDRQIAAMLPGALACDIDAIVREGLCDAGLRSAYRNITGYSLGYYQQFTCRSSDFTYAFRPNDTWCLQPNMVFHMYTAAHGLAFSETVLVSEAGGVRMTRSERKLFRIDVG